jgi:hypothetical protein
MDILNKMARLEKTQKNIGRMMLKNISKYSALYDKMENFISEPTEELANIIDLEIQAIVNSLEEIKTTVAESIIDPEELETINGSEDENGFRLS